MKTVIAGVLCGVVIFFWGFVAHVLLPIGEMGFKVATPAQEAAIVAAVRPGLTEDGIYPIPGMDPAKMNDEAAKKEFGERAAKSPYALVVFHAQADDSVNAMGPYLGRQFASDIACGLAIAFVLGLVTGFGRRVGAALGMGAFSFLSTNVPYWNWYRFPADFTVGALIEVMVAALLGGIVAAWWLGRGER